MVNNLSKQLSGLISLLCLSASPVLTLAFGCPWHTFFFPQDNSTIRTENQYFAALRAADSTALQKALDIDPSMEVARQQLDRL